MRWFPAATETSKPHIEISPFCAAYTHLLNTCDKNANSVADYYSATSPANATLLERLNKTGPE